MENPSRGPASFWTQTDALFRKNLAFQKRRKMANCRLLVFPVLFCAILAYAQSKLGDNGKSPTSPQGKVCSASEMYQTAPCSIPKPPENPPLLQLPDPKYRAVRTAEFPFGDLPDGSCKRTKSCPATILVTGNNKSFGIDLAGQFFPNSSVVDSSDILSGLASGVFGTIIQPEPKMFIDPALGSPHPIYNLQSRCSRNSTVSILFPIGSEELEKEVKCIQGLCLWRNSSSEIHDQILKGFSDGNRENKSNEIVAAYDFLDSNNKKFNVSIWYNSTVNDDKSGDGESKIRKTMRVPRLVNLVSNAYLEFLRGPDFKILFKFFKEMPKVPTSQKSVDLSTGAAIFFTWIIFQQFPVILTNLVYEKQQNLRMMMKMHGLGDGPYWLISYIYFLSISLAYMSFLMVSCSILGFKIFTVHNYPLQCVFYFVYINLQIAFSFLVSGIFSKVRNASVVGFLVVFATGLFGESFFKAQVDDPSFPRIWVTVMELFPGLALYRIIYEFSIRAQDAGLGYVSGMRWKDLNDSSNGLKEVLIIMVVEWFVFLFFLYCVDKKSFSLCFRRRPSSSFKRNNLEGYDQEQKADVDQERAKVEELLVHPDRNYSIICDDLKKVYPGKDGNPAKEAVKGLSLALPRGECFGMLGPNGAGKSTFIKMMIGLTKPSSGTAFVEGMDIHTDMDSVYTSMGVCPQHDLLWETLTAREHLLFYGRLKNLKGSALNRAVEESLRGVNLLNGGDADKQAGKYSGGMKRRLSVAISLIGDPKVVYMDEPSTGLDPASRNELWNVVMRAKTDRAIILTTHSMEEAEHLCDRLGIFVDGSLQCIGNAKQLKARYGGFYVFTITTSPDNEKEVESLVLRLTPNANKTYQISGTQKYELPKNEVKIADVFEAVEVAKCRFPVQAWGLVDTTLEDVFIKVARGAEAFTIDDPIRPGF